MFRECNSLITLDVTSLNVSNVRVMTNFLRDAANLQSVDVSTWDTSSAIQMPKMFLGCASLTTITGLEDFAIPLVTKMNQILLDITLPTAQYSELLINFAAQANGATFSFSGGNSKYSVGAATTARATWVASGVTITDGGQE
jgi:surface protein